MSAGPSIRPNGGASVAIAALTVIGLVFALVVVLAVRATT